MTLSRTLSVADLAIRLCCEADDVAMLEERYGPFLIPAQGRADAEITLALYPPSGEPWRSETLSVDERGDHFRLCSPGFEAEIARSGATATLRAPRLERCVDAVLRYVLARRLLARGGLLLHASAVVRDGRAWIFAGASGVGKTTIGAHLPGSLLCDEAVALLRHRSGLVCHATPYWTAIPRTAAVAGIVFPERGANSICTLSPARAVGKLASCVGPLLPSAQTHVLDASEKLLQEEGLLLLHARLASIAAISSYLSETLERLSAPANALE